MNIERINGLLDKEIEFAKGCGMPQFVMGLLQAKKIINDYKNENSEEEDFKENYNSYIEQ